MPRQARNGWIRGFFNFPSVSNAAANPHFAGNGALTIINSFTPGFGMILERISFVASEVAAASAGSQVFKLRKGGASGTVIATLTIAYTDVDALGDVISAAVSGTLENLTLDDDDTFSLTRDASGTDYTTEPEGFWSVRFRQRPQHDA